MIPVSRPSEAPKVLNRNGNKWLHKLQQALANLEILKNQPIINPKELAQAEKEVEKITNKYRHKEIKEDLEKIFNGKCAYCESKVTTTGYGDIEHFCPKSNSRCINLTFEWTNLLLSCERCNDAGHKGTKFPLDANDNPLLINPTDKKTDINKHLRFSWDSKIGSRIEGIDARGQVVEDIFDLNSQRGTRKELVNHRNDCVNDMMALLEIARQTGSYQAIQLLLEHCQPSREYSAFAFVHILPHLAHHFRDPRAIALLKKVSKRSPAYAVFSRVHQLP